MVRYRSRRPPDTELRGALASARQRAAALWLSSAVRPAAAGGRAVRDQSYPSALPGGRARDAQAPQSLRRPRADPGGAEAECALVSGLRVGPVRRRRRFRILNIVDDVTKECLGAIANTSILGRRVAREADLDRHLARQAGFDRLGQRHRVHLQRDAGVVQGQRHRLALHCAWRADPERVRLGEAGRRSRDLAVDLKVCSDGTLPWSDVDRGVLLPGAAPWSRTERACSAAGEITPDSKASSARIQREDVLKLGMRKAGDKYWEIAAELFRAFSIVNCALAGQPRALQRWQHSIA